MPTFTRKPKVTQQAEATQSTIPRRTQFGRSPERQSSLQLERTIANQAETRWLQRAGTDGGRGPESQSHTEHSAENQGHLQTKRHRQKVGGIAAAPPIVHEVLNSPGQQLEAQARISAESRFNHDFSRVRVHTGKQAGDSARAVNAQAYTVGRNVVFGEGKYAPYTPAGKRLLFHELTHIVQQRDAPGYRYRQSLEIGPPNNPSEVEASIMASALMTGTSGHSPPSSKAPSTTLQLQRQDVSPATADVESEPVTLDESERLGQQGAHLPSLRGQTRSGVGGSPYSAALPGYSQAGDTCGAASLVTALLVWDRQHWDSSKPNHHVVDACNLVLIELSRHGSQAVERWARHPAANTRKTCAGDSD